MPHYTIGTDWTDIGLPYSPTRGGAIIQNKSDEIMEIRIGETDTNGFELAPKSSPLTVGGSLVTSDHTRGGFAMGQFQARCASGGKILYTKEL